MISVRLRNALAALSMLVIVGGPVLAILGVLIVTARSGSPDTGKAFELFFGSLITGGVLRMLVSIDARLEARA